MEKNTGIITGYDCYCEETAETITMFSQNIGEVFREAKEYFLKYGKSVAINKCNEKCHLENDGTLWETVEYNSYRTIALFDKNGFQVFKNDSLDLFDNWLSLPKQIIAILDKYSGDDNTYISCELLQKEFNQFGYTMEYDLSATPYNLRVLKYGLKISETNIYGGLV